MNARYRTLFLAASLSWAGCGDSDLPVQDHNDHVEIEDAQVDAAVREVDAAVADAAVREVDAAVADAAVREADAAVADAAVEPPDAMLADAQPAPVESHLPCDVEAILATHCQGCHTPTARNGTSLMTHDDLLAPSKRDPAATVAQRVLVRASSVESPMPPVGTGELLSVADLAVIATWIAQGSPEGSCD